MLEQTKETSTVLVEATVNPVPDQTNISQPICGANDKECVARWVQAFSDCE